MNDIDFSADSDGEAELSTDKLQRLGELSRLLRATQEEVAARDRDLEDAENRQRRLEQVDIPELMKECGVTELKLEDGSKIAVGADFTCSVPEERKAAAYAWLRERGLGGIIKINVGVAFGRDEGDAAEALREKLEEEGHAVEVEENVHWQTLKATLKEERTKGRDVPAGLFGLHVFDTTKVTPPPGVAPPPKPRKKKK